MEDEKIIELYWNRNEDAISETEKKYGAYCMTVANNILASFEDASECVNDTYMNTWNAIPPVRPKIFSAFLGRITRNLAFSRYRKEHAEKRGGGEIALVLDELADIVSDKDDAEKQLVLSELKDTINLFLKGLPENKRNFFVRRYWHCDSVKEIAGRYGVSTASVTMSLSRMREKLREFLAERGFEV